jgi:hypothetical protein
MIYDFDLAVVGGGSGGFGAALAASRRGLKVLLVEAAPMLGGNSTLGGVNTWEPGICGPGFSAELFARLSSQLQAIGLSRTTKFYSNEQPWGLSEIDGALRYELSLRRSGTCPENLVRVTFEPQLMAREMEKLLREAGTQIAFNTRFIGAKTEGERITELAFSSSKGEWKTRSRLVIDSTAGLHLSRAVNCKTHLGEEAQNAYDEPSAPRRARERLNGVSLCFRIEKGLAPRVEPLPDAEKEPFQVAISITQYPNGDLNLNPLPIMEGIEYLRHCQRSGEASARHECEGRVLLLWHWLQTEHGFEGWRIKQFFPMMGVREGARLVGRRVLTEHDVRAGWQDQRDADRIIALADHALDVHGEGYICRELSTSYGVPYECLLPREYSNLAVACRGASFSHIAASSCRLSRTMMDLGHAAGLAAALASEGDTAFPEVNIASLRTELKGDNVHLGTGYA